MQIALWDHSDTASIQKIEALGFVEKTSKDDTATPSTGGSKDRRK